jgi:hypothetical protein
MSPVVDGDALDTITQVPIQVADERLQQLPDTHIRQPFWCFGMGAAGE